MAATAERIRDVNRRYHDVAAADYDSKWGIDFGSVGQAQVWRKMARAVGGVPEQAERGLEIGAGTGYFGLNLVQLGAVRELTATDISPGMLDQLMVTAHGLGVPVGTRVAEAAELPFEDETFDLVFGHAVLHHLPNLAGAFAEFHRVLRPGGRIAFCGEPSRYGDLLAALPKRAALVLGPAWRLAIRARKRRSPAAAEGRNGHELEREVDVHAFGPDQLRTLASSAGFSEVRLRGEELLASAFGWTVRTLESTAEPEQVPWGWRRFGFRGYLALQKLDAALLEPRLPPQLFYNLVLSARRP
jgi:SAM-dependent methyltransferase